MTLIKSNVLMLSLLIMPYSSGVIAQLVDPTMPPSYSANSTKTDAIATQNLNKPKWILNSTMIDPYKELAVINGRQVQIGDEINGATIVTITHQEVELLADKTLIVLSLDKPSISRFKSQTP